MVLEPDDSSVLHGRDAVARGEQWVVRPRIGLVIVVVLVVVVAFGGLVTLVFAAGGSIRAAATVAVTFTLAGSIAILLLAWYRRVAGLYVTKSELGVASGLGRVRSVPRAQCLAVLFSKGGSTWGSLGQAGGYRSDAMRVLSRETGPDLGVSLTLWTRQDAERFAAVAGLPLYEESDPALGRILKEAGFQSEPAALTAHPTKRRRDRRRE
jgi:hypothetical protein